MAERYLGIEIGGTKLQVVLGDAEAEILERRRMTVDRNRGAEGIREQVEEAVGEFLDAEGGCRAAGIGFGGPVDVEQGTVATSNQVEGWADYPIVSWLEEVTGLPAALENDANTGALAESVKGAGREYRYVCFLTLGSGCGGGMVADGSIYHGAPPGESEVGLQALSKKGDTVESQCCGWAVDRKVRRYIADHPDSALAELVGVGEEEGGEARFLTAAIEQGDVGACAILEETAEDLAFGLSHVTHLLHPDIICLGGGLSLMGEPLRSAVATELPRFVHPAYRPPPRIAIAELGEDVIAVGALLLALRKAAETDSR